MSDWQNYQPVHSTLNCGILKKKNKHGSSWIGTQAQGFSFNVEYNTKEVNYRAIGFQKSLEDCKRKAEEEYDRLDQMVKTSKGEKVLNKMSHEEYLALEAEARSKVQLFKYPPETNGEGIPTQLKPLTTNEVIAAGLKAATEDCYGAAKSAGWYTDLQTGLPKTLNKGERLMLMVSELSEAMEGYRKNLQDDKLPHRKMEEVELADTLIRIFDYAGAEGLDLAGAYLEKRQYNDKREDHKLEHRKTENGKKF